MENLTQWFMLAVFTAGMGFIGYLVKRFLENNQEERKENTKATKELTSSTVALAEKINSFQTHCAYVETTNTKRLDSHAGEIGELQKDTIRIDAKVTEHDSRLNKVEQKIAI
jgi:hypothetical protein